MSGRKSGRKVDCRSKLKFFLLSRVVLIDALAWSHSICTLSVNCEMKRCNSIRGNTHRNQSVTRELRIVELQSCQPAAVTPQRAAPGWKKVKLKFWNAQIGRFRGWFPRFLLTIVESSWIDPLSLSRRCFSARLRASRPFLLRKNMLLLLFCMVVSHSREPNSRNMSLFRTVFVERWKQEASICSACFRELFVVHTHSKSNAESYEFLASWCSKRVFGCARLYQQFYLIDFGDSQMGTARYNFLFLKCFPTMRFYMSLKFSFPEPFYFILSFCLNNK